MSRVLRWLPLLAAPYLCYLAASYFFGGPQAPPRYRVESAATIFAALVLIRCAPHSIASDDAAVRESRVPLWLWPLFVVASVILFARSLSVGLLSDDYVLLARAVRFDFSAFNAYGFRPVPLFVWGVLHHMGASDPVFHLFNLLLHGTNAFLVVKVANAYVKGLGWAVSAGVLLLTLPINVEAVVWCSGIFDLSAATLVLTAILLGRRYRDNATPGNRLFLVATCLGGLLCKETAVVAPLLVMLDAWATRHPVRRALWLDCAMTIAAGAVYGIVRLQSNSAGGPVLTGFILQRYLFGSVGALAAPWHADLISGYAWLAVLWALAVIVLFAAPEPEAAGHARRPVALASWLVVSTLPAVAFLFVSPQLEGARYVYLSSAGWAAILMLRIESLQAARPGLRPLALVGLLGFAAAGAFGIHRHMAPWQEAAQLRDRVERAGLALYKSANCASLSLDTLPDSVRGAYVFRNGAPEAFRRDLQVPVEVASAPGACPFSW